MSLGGSSQKSSSETNKFGYNQSQSYLDPQQQANQQNLVGNFNQQLSQFQNNPQFQQQQANLFGQNQNIIGNHDLGTMQTQRQFAQQDNPYLQNTISNYGQDIAQQYGRMLPGIGGQYAGAGQRGSSRQGIAEGLLGQSAMQQFSQGANDLRFQGYQSQQDAAQQAVQNQLGLRDQQLAAIQQGSQLQQNQISNQFAPFQIGANVVGSPTALNSAYGFDILDSSSKGSGGSVNVGFT